MIKSMTGFGRGVAEGEGVKASVDIRTVNNRYLDVHTRLPQEHMDLELGIKKQVQATLKRGRVDLTVSVDRSGTTSFQLNREFLRGYVDALRSIVPGMPPATPYV